MSSIKNDDEPMSEDFDSNWSQEEIDKVINDVIACVRQDFMGDSGDEDELLSLLDTTYSKNLEDNSAIGPNSASFPVKQDGDEQHVADPEPKDDVVVKEESPNKEAEIEAMCLLGD